MTSKKTPNKIKKYLPNILHGIGSAIALISAILGGINPVSNPGLVWNYTIFIYLGYQTSTKIYKELNKLCLEDEYFDIKYTQYVKLLFTVATGILAFITRDSSTWILTSGWIISDIGTEIQRRKFKKLLAKK